MQLSIKIVLGLLGLAIIFLGFAVSRAEAHSLPPLHHQKTAPSTIKTLPLSEIGPFAAQQ